MFGRCCTTRAEGELARSSLVDAAHDCGPPSAWGAAHAVDVVAGLGGVVVGVVGGGTLAKGLEASHLSRDSARDVTPGPSCPKRPTQMPGEGISHRDLVAGQGSCQGQHFLRTGMKATAVPLGDHIELAWCV